MKCALCGHRIVGRRSKKAARRLFFAKFCRHCMMTDDFMDVIFGGPDELWLKLKPVVR